MYNLQVLPHVVYQYSQLGGVRRYLCAYGPSLTPHCFHTLLSLSSSLQPSISLFLWTLSHSLLFSCSLPLLHLPFPLLPCHYFRITQTSQ